MTKINSELIIYLISNILRIYAFYKFNNTLFKGQKHKWQFEIFTYILFFVVNSGVYLAFENPVMNVITNIICLFITTLAYKSKLYLKIIQPILVYAIGMMLDCILYFFVDISVFFSSGMATSFLFFLVSLLFEACYNEKGFHKIGFLHIGSIFLIPLGSIVIGAVTMSEYEPKMVVEAIILLLINVLVFYLYDSLDRMYIKLNESSILEEQNKAYVNQLKIAYQAQEDISCFRHDMKNHFYKIKSLTVKQEYEELLKYVDASADCMLIEKCYIHSGNDDIDSLINYKLTQAEKMNSKITVEAKLPSQIQINAFDINVILGNLLDNALEALQKCRNRELYINIMFSKGVLHIVVKNTFEHELVEENNILKTTKEFDSDRHGIGLYSVNKTLNNYNGLLELKHQDKYFTAYVMMYL